MVTDSRTLLWRGKHLLTDEFPKIMLKYCKTAGLKEFCKIALYKNEYKCFNDDYIEKIFRQEGV
ncbi:MAG: hypothetical protein P8Y23_18725 [Candidatus Lokiarchaeota archaeon]|jgi:hypothetical protein